VVVDDGRNQAYVLNRFEGSVSVIDLTTELAGPPIPFFDPTPAEILTGRKHLYDTHKNSGLGQVSCASCHVDSRMDRLSWDLGDPSGSVKMIDAAIHNLGGNFPGLNNNFTDFHPMKGPMTTQTLQDIMSHGSLHWRGDRADLAAFNPAYVSLMGREQQITAEEMQAFGDFLGTIHLPPNPYRNVDDTLPNELRNVPGTPFKGNPTTGETLFTSGSTDAGQPCNSCHSGPEGAAGGTLGGVTPSEPTSSGTAALFNGNVDTADRTPRIAAPVNANPVFGRHAKVDLVAGRG